MGQGYPLDKRLCCNCNGNPNGPIQVIHESGSIVDGGGSGRGMDVNQAILAYSPKSAPPKVHGSQLQYDLAEPEPAPSLMLSEMTLDPSMALETVPEDNQVTQPAPTSPLNTLQSQSVQRSAPSSKKGGFVDKSPPLMTAQDPFTTLDSLPNEPFATMEYEEMTKRQKSSAKQLVKDFVKTMVRGRQFSAVLPTGQTRACFCALNRGLDKLQIRANERDRHGRTVPLQNIAEIVVGSDKGASAATSGLETPLDDLSVTLVLETEECITFRLEDIESRDKLAACLTMFSGQARTGKRGG